MDGADGLLQADGSNGWMQPTADTVSGPRHHLAASSANDTSPNVHGCYCFRLCTPFDVERVRSRLPQPATASWQWYLKAVYGEAQKGRTLLPVQPTDLEIFYPALLPTQPCHQSEASKLPRCTTSTCSNWLQPPLRQFRRSSNRTFVLSTDGLVSRRRAEFVLSQAPVGQRRAWPASAWVEVVRRTTDLLRDDHGRFLFPEGAASYGCWFLLAVGSGIYVHTGPRTLSFATTPSAVEGGHGHLANNLPVDACFAKVVLNHNPPVTLFLTPICPSMHASSWRGLASSHLTSLYPCVLRQGHHAPRLPQHADPRR